ncbi:MAG: hypothetical protein JXA06_07735 [Bacteroidetes bacterium]|nr:hypothetical protein [Bacteroidota bacterium]
MKHRKLTAFLGIIMIMSVSAGMVLFIGFLLTPHADKKIAAWMMHAEFIESCEGFLQTKQNNCGPTAIKMIFDHYHIPSSINEIEQNVNLTEKGSSMLALKRMAELKGCKAEGWNLSLKDLPKNPFPAILFVNKNHYIVADSISSDQYIHIKDPAIGRLKIKIEKLKNIWDGETLIINK